MTATIQVVVNGEACEIPAGLSINALLSHLGMPEGRVAIERNFEILSRSQWNSTVARPGDHFEIVHLVGGG
jgi:thiamine biosynthesis protein ThiS